MINTLSRMIRTGILTEPAPLPTNNVEPTGNTETLDTLQHDLWKILGRALCIRHVDTGSCNACELEIHALNNPYYNLEGIGIKFVASPRHADLLLVTGPVSVNMEEALRRTYDAMPDPKLIVAVGDCTQCGGVFGSTYATRGPIASVIPVNHTVAGCPPTPAAIMAGILEAITAASAK